MSERLPPKLASWLLHHGTSAYHRESLEGDLIELLQQGRSRAWYWRQVAAAIASAQGRRVRSLPWGAVARIVLYCFAEAAAVIAALTIADRARHAHSFAEMMSGSFVLTLAVWITAAATGFLTLIRTAKRRQAPAAVNMLMLIFGVIALGVGTLTWANSVLGDACPSVACVCPKH
jgi:hypothetical protein